MFHIPRVTTVKTRTEGSAVINIPTLIPKLNRKAALIHNQDCILMQTVVLLIIKHTLTKRKRTAQLMKTKLYLKASMTPLITTVVLNQPRRQVLSVFLQFRTKHKDLIIVTNASIKKKSIVVRHTQTNNHPTNNKDLLAGVAKGPD